MGWELFRDSSLIPLSKIANAQTRSIRVLWCICSLLMLIILVIFIILISLQYSNHYTVFQFDYNGPRYLDTIPSITLCYPKQEIIHIFKHQFPQHLEELEQSGNVPPWENPNSRLANYLLSLLDHGSDIIYYPLPNNTQSSMVWLSSEARSSLVRNLFNFSVQFVIEPAIAVGIHVLEQIPHRKYFLCTGFDIKLNNSDLWTEVKLTVTQGGVQSYGTRNDNSNPLETVSKHYPQMSVVIHQEGNLPFANYEDNMYEVLQPGNSTYLFFSKSVFQRIDLDRSPCRNSTLKLFGHDFIYDRSTCAWRGLIDQSRNMCSRKYPQNITSPSSSWTSSSFSSTSYSSQSFPTFLEECASKLDVLRALQHPCNVECETRVEKQLSHPTNTTAHPCIQACQNAKFTKYNVIAFPNENPSQSVLGLMKSTNVKLIVEEEIYTLTKLCSEIGGLCSLFVGFTFIFIFELMEAMIMWCTKTNSTGTKRKKSKSVIEASHSERKVLRNETYASPAVLTNTNSANDAIYLAEEVWTLQKGQSEGVITKETLIDLLRTHNLILQVKVT